jgi:quercetin dioxygenase-like cupin family protein
MTPNQGSEQSMTMTEFDTVQKFTMNGTPLLQSGQTQTDLANAPQLWLHAKVYAEGGENSLHAHPLEDHVFFVLAGEVTVTDADGLETVCGPFEGIMIPRGVQYTLKCTSDENLVALRIGAGDAEAIHNRKLAANKPFKTAGIGVEAPGKFFGN